MVLDRNLNTLEILKFVETMSGETAVRVQGTLALTSGSEFSTGSPASFSVTSTSQVLLAANMSRKYARISNYSNKPVWIQYNASAAVGTGIRIFSGSIYTIDSTDLWLGSIHVISEGPTVSIETFEGV